MFFKERYIKIECLQPVGKWATEIGEIERASERERENERVRDKERK